MKPGDFLNWRKALGYTQEEAGQKLGVDRSTIQNWERGATPVPRIAQLACRELMRRWKRRPEFGPVALVYADESMRPKADYPTRAVFVQCELYHNNEVAIRQSLRMRARGRFVDPLIIDQDGGIVWSTPDLLRECDRCRETARSKAKPLGPELSKLKIKKDRPDRRLDRRDSTLAVTLTRAKIMRGHLGCSDVLERSWPMSQVRQAHESHIMDLWDLKKWRRKLKYSQFEAADKLGVSRAAIQNWESERSHIRLTVGLACEEITSRWKQRPPFGPVLLIYADEPMWPESDCPSRVVCMRCELHPNNEIAIRRVSRLKETQDFFNPSILDEHGGVVWTGPELLVE